MVNGDRFLPVRPANNQDRFRGKPKFSPDSGGKLSPPDRDFLQPSVVLNAQVNTFSAVPQ